MHNIENNFIVDNLYFVYIIIKSDAYKFQNTGDKIEI